MPHVAVCKMHACEIYACEMHAYEMHAHEMHVHEIYALLDAPRNTRNAETISGNILQTNSNRGDNIGCTIGCDGPKYGRETRS